MDQSTRASLEFGEYQQAGHFSGLDGLRGVAILLVLLYHAPRFNLPWLDVLQENGRYGVSLFFVLSGFLISTLLPREARETGGISLANFYGRRAARLLPLYYAVLVFQAALIFLFNQYSPANQELFQAKLPAYIFYYSNWLPTATQGPFFFAWSLAVEEQFCLGFAPLLSWLTRRQLIAVLLVALGAKFLVFQWAGNVDADSTLWRRDFSYQEPILWGVLLGLALDKPRPFKLLQWVANSGWKLAGVFALTVAWLATHPMVAQSTWGAEILFALMTLAIGGVVARRSTVILDSPLLAHLGKVSYGMYLLHIYVESFVLRLPFVTTATVCLLFIIVLTVALASLSHRYFERPIISCFKHRFLPHRARTVNNRDQPLGRSAQASCTKIMAAD